MIRRSRRLSGIGQAASPRHVAPPKGRILNDNLVPFDRPPRLRRCIMLLNHASAFMALVSGTYSRRPLMSRSAAIT